MLHNKQFFTFRQGRVSARKYAKEQARLRDRLSRGFQRRLETSLNKAVNQISKNLTPAGELPVAFQQDLNDAVSENVSFQVRRIIKSVYQYNDDRYERPKQDFSFGFGRSALFEAAISEYLDTREPLFANISRNIGVRILTEVDSLRDEGLGVDGIARGLRQKFQQLNKTRAATIARTETHSAAGYAHDRYHRSMTDTFGITTVKQWVSTGDARTRAAHVQMNGEKVGMDEDFVMPNGSRMAYVGDSRGGASNVVNCRCVILYVEADDQIDDPIVMESVEDVPVADNGLRVDSKGRPIGISQTEFDKQFAGEESLVKAKKAVKNMEERFAANESTWDVKGWEAFKTESLFSGRKVEQYYKVGGGLKANKNTSFEYNRGLAQLDVLQQELDQLCDTFKIPRTRGFIPTRGRSIANMGDAVMGWNKKYIEIFGSRKNRYKLKSWAQGRAVSERAFNCIEYFDDPFEQMRTVAYHELGHQVHQLSWLNRGFGSYRFPQIEEIISTQKRTNGPSEYGTKNSKEWFAENFAMWAQRKEEYVDPDFMKLIDTLLEAPGE